MRENKRKNPFLIAPVLSFVPLLLFGVTRFFSIGRSGGAETYFGMAALVFAAFGIPIAAFFLLRGSPIQALKLHRITSAQWGVGIAAGIALTFQNTILKYGIFHSAFDGEVSIYGSSFAAPDSVPKWILMILFLGLFPVICEEILFRGILSFEYRFAGFWGAAVISAVLNAFLWGSFAMFPIAFAGGLLLSCVVLITGNVTCAILIHSIARIISLLGGTMAKRLAESPDSRVLFWLFVAVGYFLALFLAAFFAEEVLRRRAEANDASPRRVPKDRRPIVLYDVLSAPALWMDAACFLIFAVATVFR